MGWRVSIYKADKNNPVSINVDEYGYESADINGERIAYDCGTDTWCMLKHSNEEFKKEIKCLKEDCDQDFYSITKKGFKMIIQDFRERIIQNIKKSIEVTENPEIRELNYAYAYTPDALQYLKEELREQLKEEFFKTAVKIPVDASNVIAEHVFAVVSELNGLTVGAHKVLTAEETAKVCSQLQRERFQTTEKLIV